MPRRSSARVSAVLPPPQKDISGPSTVVDDDDDDESIFDLRVSNKASKSHRESRQSLSSRTSLNDVESDYSTPATSAAHTPAIESKPSSSRRGGRSVAPITQSTPVVDAVKRAALLRSSKLSMSSSTKRKRNTLIDQDDGDTDMNDTADAQLARALQAEEDAAAASMNNPAFDLSIRRTPRKNQKLLPKSDYVCDFDDDDLDIGLPVTSRSSKKLKVELGSTGSNTVNFTKMKQKVEISDSEEILDFSEVEDSVEDSDFESDVPIASVKRSRIPAAKKTAAPTKRSGSRVVVPELKTESSRDTPMSVIDDSDLSIFTELESDEESDELDDADDALEAGVTAVTSRISRIRNTRRGDRIPGEDRLSRRARMERARLEAHHPELQTMWTDLENLPKLGGGKIDQPAHINRELKPFQLEGVAWMREMETTSWGGGLLGDEMGMGKTIQAVTLIMSDFPNPQPTLVLIPPVALMQWQQEIADYTSGQLKTFVFHGTNTKTKNITIKELKKYNVILMSYNSLESMYRKQEKGFKRKDGIYKEKSVVHQIKFHRVILDEAHNIKV